MAITIRNNIGGTHGFPKKGVGWVAYIWLVYLVFFIWEPIVNPTLGKAVATLVGVATFIALYFGLFVTKIPAPRLCVGGMFQSSAIQKFHGDEALALRFTDFVDHTDIGMVQSRRSPRLPAKSLQHGRILGYQFGQEFKRD